MVWFIYSRFAFVVQYSVVLTVSMLGQVFQFSNPQIFRFYLLLFLVNFLHHRTDHEYTPIFDLLDSLVYFLIDYSPHNVFEEINISKIYSFFVFYFIQCQLQLFQMKLLFLLFSPFYVYCFYKGVAD